MSATEIAEIRDGQLQEDARLGAYDSTDEDEEPDEEDDALAINVTDETTHSQNHDGAVAVNEALNEAGRTGGNDA